MKRAILLAASAVACLSLIACASGPPVDPGGAPPAVVSVGLDAKAVRFEGAVASLADALAVVAYDPAIDRAKLARQTVAARAVLERGRSAYDARSGSPADLAREAMDLIAAAAPVDVSPRAAQALLAARLALAVYAGSVPMTGVPASASEGLQLARARTDLAIAGLLRALPPPGS